MIWHYDKDLERLFTGSGRLLARRNTCRLRCRCDGGSVRKNWSELGGLGIPSHPRNRTMPRYPLMNLIPADYQEDA